MRYDAEHKPKIRQKILDAASRLFRTHGYHGVGIDRIMEATKLTRGGFYGHFKSKQDLFQHIWRRDHDFTVRLKSRSGESRDALAQGAAEVFRGYLTPEYRKQIGNGCSVASLSVDVARSPAPVKRAYKDALEELVAEIRRGGIADRGDALAMLAMCVGGLTISRACDDDGVSADIAEGCMRRIEAFLSERG